MRKFLGRKVGGVSFLVIAIALAVLVMGGVVLAYYNITSVQGNVTVSEIFEVSPGYWDTLELYPGDSEVLEMTVTNLSPDPKTVQFNASVTPDGLDAVFSGGDSDSINGNQTKTYYYNITVPMDAPVASYTVLVNVER